MAVDAALDELVRSYEIRRRELFAAARNAEASHRPELADKCRAARTLLEHAMNDELINRQPSGIGTWEKLP
jgi:hypothetical protein